MRDENDRPATKPSSPRKRRRYRLEQLINAISEENRHPEIDWGAPHGGEAW
jgi:antitoxin component of MazEF toxin-antitoxin module